MNLTPAAFNYVDRNNRNRQLYFQFNPTTLKRTRTVTFTETKGNDPLASETDRSAQGKKFSLKAQRWKLDFDIRLDASMPPLTKEGAQASGSYLGAVQQGLDQLEALVEPGPVPSENDSLYGFQLNPDPPLIYFTWGARIWSGYMTSLTISEVQFTPDLVPKRVEATVSLVVIETPRQLAQGKTGGRR